MSIQQKVESTKKALSVASNLISFCIETKNFVSDTQESLFPKIVARDLSEEQKENEINIAAIGILVIALSTHYSRYQGIQEKEKNLSPYLWDENGHLKSPYYPKQYQEVLAISGIEPAKQDNETDDAYNERLVLAVGTKVMNGKLPFQPEILNEIFDKHLQNSHRELQQMMALNPTSHDRIETIKQAYANDIIVLKEYVSAISAKINTFPRDYEASKIETIFTRALNTALTSNDTSEKKKFMNGLVALKQAVLTNFQKEEANFRFDDCEIIANSALTLAAKVGSNTVTKADVNEFSMATQKYKTSHLLAIALAIIIGAIMGMIAGAAVGFAVGSVPGALIGGIAGLAVGGGIAGVSSTMWYTKKDPLNQISSAAAEMMPNQSTPGV